MRANTVLQAGEMVVDHHLQQRRRILFYLNILKGMLHPITSAAAVAVNTAMRTAAIKIHSVLGGKDPLYTGKMHADLVLQYFFILLCVQQPLRRF